VFFDEFFQVVDIDLFFKKILRIHAGSQKKGYDRKNGIHIAYTPTVIPVANFPFVILELIQFIHLYFLQLVCSFIVRGYLQNSNIHLIERYYQIVAHFGIKKVSQCRRILFMKLIFNELLFWSVLEKKLEFFQFERIVRDVIVKDICFLHFLDLSDDQVGNRQNQYFVTRFHSHLGKNQDNQCFGGNDAIKG